VPDAEEERPPYFAEYGNVDFTATEQVNKRIVGQPTARENGDAMAFVIIAAEVARSAREIHHRTEHSSLQEMPRTDF
jgi:hypothetical protein